MRNRVLFLSLGFVSLLGACSGNALSAVESNPQAQNVAQLRGIRNTDVENLKTSLLGFLSVATNDRSGAAYMTTITPLIGIAQQVILQANLPAQSQPIPQIIATIEANPNSDLLLAASDPMRATLAAFAQQFASSAQPAVAAATSMPQPLQQALTAAVSAANDVVNLLQTSPDQLTQLANMGCLQPTDPSALAPGQLLPPDPSNPGAQLMAPVQAPGTIVTQPMLFGTPGLKGKGFSKSYPVVQSKGMPAVQSKGMPVVQSKGMPVVQTKGMPYSPPSLQTGYSKAGQCGVYTGLASRQSGQFVTSPQQCGKSGCFVKRIFRRLGAKLAAKRNKGFLSTQGFGKAYPSLQTGKAYPSAQTPVVYPSAQTPPVLPSTQLTPALPPGPASVPGTAGSSPALLPAAAASDAAPPAPMAPSSN